MGKIFKFVCLCGVILFVLYALIGTSTRVDEIKQRAPKEIAARGWDIMRYEGYQLGSLRNHGGKVWYHVRNTDDHDIQYRVYITLWGNELHFIYNKPEPLSRVKADIDITK